MLSQFSVLGLLSLDPDLFSGLNLPADLDRSLAISTITMDAAELNILYPDPDYMKIAIEIWSKTRVHSWERMLEALSEEYNPLWNKDGTITETRQRSGKASEKGNVSDQGSASTEDIHAVQGYNTAHWQNAEKDTGSSKTSSNTDSSRSRDESETETITRKDQGNIGVTMSQEMLKAELDVRKQDLYHIIAEEFKLRFCLMVY